MGILVLRIYFHITLRAALAPPAVARRRDEEILDSGAAAAAGHLARSALGRLVGRRHDDAVRDAAAQVVCGVQGMLTLADW